MTIFNIILIPDFIKREHILEKYLFILDSQNISPLHEVEFSPTNEIGAGYPCVFLVSHVISRMCISSRKVGNPCSQEYKFSLCNS